MTITLPQCAFCKHLLREDITANRCSAFSGGIPVTIFLNDHDHRAPYNGDHGIQFEPIDDEAAEMVAEMFADGEEPRNGR